MTIVAAIPIYFLLLSFPETSTALSARGMTRVTSDKICLTLDIERHIAINRFGRGSTRHTDVTWNTDAFIQSVSPGTAPLHITLTLTE